jgi:hypothetical protein
MVTSRSPRDTLHRALKGSIDVTQIAVTQIAVTQIAVTQIAVTQIDVSQIDITRIGDCLAPGTIASCVYAGHRYTRKLDAPPTADVPFRREFPGC